jgi:hypothetical protein
VARATDGGGAVPQRLIDDQVLQLLFSFAWISGEATEQGITVTDAEVRQSFVAQRRQSFPELAAYRRFLRRSHETEADIDARMRAIGPDVVPREHDVRLARTRSGRARCASGPGCAASGSTTAKSPSSSTRTTA